MILVDTSVIIHAAGAAHPNKAPSAELLARIGRGEIEATVDAVVLQELMEHYRETGQWAVGRRVVELTRQLFANILPLSAAVTDRAARLLDADPRLVPRAAIHAAIVMTAGLEGVCSYDSGFDRIMGLARQEPAGVP